MATYYVGAGGNDGNAGTSWALRKATVDAMVSLMTTAGDIGIIGAGVYREAVTLDASGSSGNPMTLIGDVTGEYTDGIGGYVVLTGSDDDADGDRASVIVGSARNYWVFRDLVFEAGTGFVIAGMGTNCEWYDCVIDGSDSGSRRTGIECSSFGRAIRCEFRNCGAGGSDSGFYCGADSVVQGCSFIGCNWGVRTTSARVTVQNNSFVYGGLNFVSLVTGLTGADRNLFYSNIVDGTGTAAYSQESGSVLADGNVVSADAGWTAITPTNNTVSNRRCLARGARFFKLTGRGPVINGAGALWTSDDHFGTPDGIGAGDVGPIRYAPPGTWGASGGTFVEPGYRDFDVPVPHSTAFTLTVNVSWSGTITSKPELILFGRYGISTQTDTATGSGSTEGLSVGGTATVPGGGNGIMRVRLYAPEVDTSVTFILLEAA